MDFTGEDISCIRWLKANNLAKDFFRFIHRTDARGRFLSGISGFGWEDELKDILNDKDIPWAPSPKLNERHELIVNDMTVQCKFTGNSRRAPISHNGHTMLYNIGDYDVLALKIATPEMSRRFIIPAEELHDPSKPGKLLGTIGVDKIKRWEDAWWVLNQSPQPSF